MSELISAERYADILATDRGNPPDFLLERSTHDLGNEPVSKEVFRSPEWFTLEREKVWKKTWQMACRENDIPNVGDQIVYDIIDQSVIVVRTAPGQIRSYHNACRHRANRLLDGGQSSRTIRCSFHGWTWDINGELTDVPCRWDFPSLTEKESRLQEVRTESWNGWVFINLDDDCDSLAAHLGPEIPAQFERWPADNVWKGGHVGKVLPCNWKLALEAFLEAYHSVATHPQILPYFADSESLYDFYGPHARWVGASGVSSEHIAGTDAQEIVDAMIGDAFADLLGEHSGEVRIPQVQPGQTARELLADFMKSSLGQLSGRDFSSVSDAEILDGFQYFVFPNFVVFGGYGFPLAYRFTPNGRDPESCIFEVMAFVNFPEGSTIPRDTQLRMTPTEEPWSEAKEVGGLGLITDQDTFNLMKIQRGLASDSVTHIQYANYQERNLRNFHQHLRRLIEGTV